MTTTSGMKLNVQAYEMNRRLFDLCYDLGNLALAARNKLDFDAAEDDGKGPWTKV